MLPPHIRALSQLGQGDTLPLAFTDQVAFKLRKGSHNAQEQMRHGGVFSREGQVFLLKADMNTALREPEDHFSQVVQIAGQPVHRVADHGIAFAHITGQAFQLGPVKILPGSLSMNRLSR